MLAASMVHADTVADLPYRIGGDGRVSTDVFVNGQGLSAFQLSQLEQTTGATVAPGQYW